MNLTRYLKKEETDALIRIKRMLWSEECFWEWRGRLAHNISFYYLIEKCEGFEIWDYGAFVAHKDNGNVVIGWMEIERLKGFTVYPAFLKQEIDHLDGAIKHFVSKG